MAYALVCDENDCETMLGRSSVETPHHSEIMLCWPKRATPIAERVVAWCEFVSYSGPTWYLTRNAYKPVQA